MLKKNIEKLMTSMARGAMGVAKHSPHVYETLVSGLGNTSRLPSFGFTEMEGEVAQLLDEIPSETARGERQFLYQYFRYLWSGRGNVIEIGPFIGGTTRAIALGMSQNPRCSTDSRLITYDKFQDYHDTSRLKDYLDPLVQSGKLSSSVLDAMDDSANFLDVFRSVHSPHEYFRYIDTRDEGVPNTKEEASPIGWLKLPSDQPIDAVFIDGCKSWYGTKYFLSEACSITSPGAAFIFQDYGWFTCFWLSAFMGTFPQHFDLFGRVHCTYAFSQTKPLSVEQIEAEFPDSPEEFGEDRFLVTFDRLIDAAEKRHDRYSTVRLTMQKAASMAYLGKLDQAREILNAAEKLPEASEHRSEFRAAWNSPTYRPEGAVTLGRSSS